MLKRYSHDTIQTGAAEPPSSPPDVLPRFGILGGGQLAKMTALSALQLGCRVVVLEKNHDSPAASVASQTIAGDWRNPETLQDFASQVDVITLENEFVDAASLRALEEQGARLFPAARTLALVQDKLVQKQTLAAAGLPVPRFQSVTRVEEVIEFGANFGWPLLLKVRRGAYDGKGNATLHSPSQVDAAWTKLAGDRACALFVEEFCDFSSELAVIVTRGRGGETAAYPVAETVQCEHVCHLVKAPATISVETAARASELARAAVAAVEAVGSFGVEMFLIQEGGILLNELAPRVHNSGHYTIEACACSQFENHVRAVLGWPLGSTRMITPAAAMVNLLGAGPGPGRPHGLQDALAVPGAHIHIYGKAVSGTGRKMGHVTALGAALDETVETASRAAGRIRFGARETTRA